MTDRATAGLPAWHGPFAFSGLPYTPCPAGDGWVERGQLASVDTATRTIWHDYCAMRHISFKAATGDRCPPLSLSRRS